MKHTIITLMIALLWAGNVSAQKTKVSEKEIVGVWTMESYQWEGEKLQKCGREMGYTQVKYYGADGEYASAGIAMNKDGKCVVMPQEYGTYYLRDGWYMEMGRKPLKDAIVLVDKVTYKGKWKNRHDVWKKQTKMPERLVRYIIDCCKMKDTPDDVQQLIKKHIFK